MIGSYSVLMIELRVGSKFLIFFFIAWCYEIMKLFCDTHSDSKSLLLFYDFVVFVKLYLIEHINIDTDLE